ncbi:MAG: ABC transporter permease [Bacillota bacterium]
MSELLKSMNMEYRKIAAKRKSLIICYLTAAFVMGIAVLSLVIGKNLSLALNIGQYYPVWILSFMMKLLLPLFILMTVIDSTTGEFQDDTISNTFQLPVDRYQIYLGKLSANFLFAAKLMFIALGSGILGAILVDGLSVLSALHRILPLYCLALLALGLIIAAAGMLSLFFRTSSLAMIISILIWTVLNTAGIFFGQLYEYLPSTVAAMYTQLTDFSRLLCLLSYYIIFTILGILKFQIKEV